MRKERGNIILTALFVAIFLFFLSIALIWTNRQDIALSLAMEHKMKGEAAARSGAMMAYASLRNFDKPLAESEGTLPSGATWKVELVELPPEGRRGSVLLVRSRGTSGPLSSYFTMHLLKSELGMGLGGGTGRLLGFIGKSSSSGGSGESTGSGETLEVPVSVEPPPPEESSGSSVKAQALYGDFELKSLDLAIQDGKGFVAYQGPLFTTSTIESGQSPMAAIDYIPVLDPNGGKVTASGPAVLMAPKLEKENTLSVLEYKNEEFEWSPIPFPIDPTVEQPNPPAKIVLQTVAPVNGAWTTLGIRSIREAGSSNYWKDSRPATSSDAEAADLDIGTTFEAPLQNVPDWSSVKSVPPQRAYVLRGTIAAYKNAVYSHAWEYLYLRYSGQIVNDPIPRVAGSTITRWPCIRKYDLNSKTWSTVWSPLKDNGDVASEILPDPSVLVVDSQDRCYSRTLTTPVRLLELEPNGDVKEGEELTGMQLFIYQNEPYSISDDPAKPGLKNLKSKKIIGFEGMVRRIPEISGLTVPEVPGEEIFKNGTSKMGVSVAGAPGSALAEMRTTRLEYTVNYQIDPNSNVVCDGKDIYTNLIITLEKTPSRYNFFGTFRHEEPKNPVLARYDGERWHILPNGLMSALSNPLDTPGNYIFCAHYPGMPENKSRYTVISIDVDPFEFDP